MRREYSPEFVLSKWFSFKSLSLLFFKLRTIKTKKDPIKSFEIYDLGPVRRCIATHFKNF